MSEPEDPLETVEGMVWPIVVLVELGTAQLASLTRALEVASIIVLVEGSMSRAVKIVKEQKPHVVVAPDSIPPERTQVLRDTCTELGIDVLFVSSKAAPLVVLEDVRKAVARVAKARHPRK